MHNYGISISNSLYMLPRACTLNVTAYNTCDSLLSITSFCCYGNWYQKFWSNM